MPPSAVTVHDNIVVELNSIPVDLLLLSDPATTGFKPKRQTMLAIAHRKPKFIYDAIIPKHCSTSSTTSAPYDSSKRTTVKGRVSFQQELIIVEFPYTVGDHPCCSSDQPLTIDWRPQQTNIASLNEYDFHQQLVMPESEREQLLLKSGCSQNEIRMANAQQQRFRKQRQATHDNLELNETLQMFAKIGRKIKTLWNRIIIVRNQKEKDVR